MSRWNKEFHTNGNQKKAGVTILISDKTDFLLFWPHHAACGILVPQPGIKPVTPAMEVWSLNHWTSREVPKIDFKIKTVTRDKEGHYIMIKGAIQEEDVTTVNIYAPNIRAPQYIRRIPTAIKEEIDRNTITVGSLTPHFHHGKIIQTENQ